MEEACDICAVNCVIKMKWAGRKKKQTSKGTLLITKQLEVVVASRSGRGVGQEEFLLSGKLFFQPPNLGELQVEIRAVVYR